MTKKPTKLERQKFELETARLTISNQKNTIDEISKEYKSAVWDYRQRIEDLTTEFTNLKEAWQSQQDDIIDLKKAQHSFYNTSKYHFHESEALKRVIFKYEIFTISVVALVTMHIVWLFT